MIFILGWSYCAACQTKVENFHDEQWDDRDIERAEKYVFFLPLLKDGYGDRPEATVRAVLLVFLFYLSAAS